MQHIDLVSQWHNFVLGYCLLKYKHKEKLQVIQGLLNNVYMDVKSQAFGG